MREKEQVKKNYSNTAGTEILLGPFIEQLIPLLKRLPEKMKTLMKWLSFATSPKVVLLLLLIFVLGIWGSYIFLMKFSPKWFIWMIPENFISSGAASAAKDINYAELGDSYGFINTLFAGFAVIGVIFTLWQQSKNIKLQAKSIEQQSTSIQLQQASIIAQINAANEQSKVNNAQIKATWMQDAMKLISHLSAEVQKLSISYTCEDGITINTKRGIEVVKLMFELSCLICVFKLASSLARKRGIDSSSCVFYFWEVKNTFNDCLFELKHFMTIRKYVIKRIFAYAELSTQEKEQLLFTLPLEETKEITLLRALMIETISVNASHEYNELSVIGITDESVKEKACYILTRNTSNCLREIISNVLKKQRSFNNYQLSEFEQIITDMNTALQNPDIYNELQDIAKQLINEGMEMSL